MPADHCCRLDDHQGVTPIRPEPGDQDPEPAIGWMQSWSGVFRLSTANCWRIAKLSKYEAANTRSSRCEMGYEKQSEHLSRGREAIRPVAG